MMLFHNALGVLFSIACLVPAGVLGLDLNAGLDELLFKPFCDRASVQNTVKECYVGVPKKKTNFFGLDFLSEAEDGIVALPSQVIGQAEPQASTFTIVSKGKVEIECITSPQKDTKDPADFAQIIPATSVESVLDLSPIFYSGGNRFMSGVFVNGATIVFKTNSAFSCEWLVDPNE